MPQVEVKIIFFKIMLKYSRYRYTSAVFQP